MYTKDRAPTPEEVAAHGGLWLCGRPNGFNPRLTCSPLEGAFTHYTPLSADGRLVPWPGAGEGLEVVIVVGVRLGEVSREAIVVDADDPDWLFGALEDTREAGEVPVVVRAVVPEVPPVPEVQGEVVNAD